MNEPSENQEEECSRKKEQQVSRPGSEGCLNSSGSKEETKVLGVGYPGKRESLRK